MLRHTCSDILSRFKGKTQTSVSDQDFHFLSLNNRVLDEGQVPGWAAQTVSRAKIHYCWAWTGAKHQLFYVQFCEKNFFSYSPFATADKIDGDSWTFQLRRVSELMLTTEHQEIKRLKQNENDVQVISWNEERGGEKRICWWISDSEMIKLLGLSLISYVFCQSCCGRLDEKAYITVWHVQAHCLVCIRTIRPLMPVYVHIGLLWFRIDTSKRSSLLWQTTVQHYKGPSCRIQRCLYGEISKGVENPPACWVLFAEGSGSE